MTTRKDIKKIADHIIQIAAYKSLVTDYPLEHNGKYFWEGWRRQRLETNATFATNFYGEVPDSIVHDPSAYEQFKHFWHCVFEEPTDFVAYWFNRMLVSIKAILGVTFSVTIKGYLVLLLMGANGTKGAPLRNLGYLFILALIVSFIVIVGLYIMASPGYKQKVFKVKVAAPLWLTIWHLEDEQWVAYDYWLNGHKLGHNLLDEPLADGLALLSGYSKDELDQAYVTLNYLERLLIIPDSYCRDIFSWPVKDEYEAAYEYDEKREQIRIALYEKLLKQVGTICND